jgi:hypothetical protein
VDVVVVADVDDAIEGVRLCDDERQSLLRVGLAAVAMKVGDMGNMVGVEGMEE